MELQFKHAVLFMGFILTSIAACSAYAANQIYDERWYIAPQLTYVWADSNRHVDDGSGLRLDFGKPVSETWNFEIGVNDYKLDFKKPLAGSSHQTAYGLNGLWFFLDRPRPFAPFVLLGAGVNDQRPDAGSNSNDAYATLGIGFTSSPWRWSGAIRASLQHLKMFGHGNYGDTILSIGLQIPLGPAAPAPVAAVKAAPAPAPVVMSPDIETVHTLPPVIELEGVNFAHDSDAILPESQPVLDETVETLKNHPNVQVEVGGHTDNNGDAAYNLDLSRRRAASVEKYLIEHGIAPHRLTAKGYGETEPIATNDTPEGRAENRRVELRILDDSDLR